MKKFARSLESVVEGLLQRDWLFRAMLIAGALLPLAFAVRIALIYDNPVDFRYFWAAGQIWADGGNPYAPEFSETAGELYGIDGFHRWLYSPHVWGVAYFLAAFEFSTAFWIWTTINIVLIYAGTFLVASAVLDFDHRWHWMVTILLLFYTISSIGGAMTQTIGQFSAFTYFAAAAFAHAAIRCCPWLMTMALFVITMKASLGLAFVAFTLAAQRWRGALLAAGALSFVFALPAILTSGVGPFISGYLDGVAAYQDYSPNAAPSMTGLRNAVYYLFGADMSGLWLSVMAAVFVASFARFGGQTGNIVTTVTVCLAVIFFLVPLHTYDLMLVSVLAIGATRWQFAMIYALALFILYRVHRLSGFLGIEEATNSFPGSLMTTVVIGILLVSSIILFFYDIIRRRGRAFPRS